MLKCYKKYSSFFIIFTFLLIHPLVAKASGINYKILDSQNNVEVNKSWTIHFNKALNKESVNLNSIKIVEQDTKEEVPITLYYDSSKNDIVVTPAKNYEYGKKYSLIVGSDIDSVKGDHLDNSTQMDFTVQNNSTSALSSSNINTSTSNSEKALTLKEVAQNSNAVVYIEVNDITGKPFASGSGFIVNPDGEVVTNFHVIDKAYSAKVTLSDGTVYDVEGVLNYSKESDIAILKLKNAENLPTVKLGDSDKLELADDVVAIGSPEGYTNTISQGIVSGFRTGQARSGKDIQITAPISHGSSGGALFNMYGEVIGITYAGIDDGENLNFAIPINDAKTFLSNSSSEKSLALINGYTIDPSTIKYFPKLSTVPVIKGVTYNREELSDDKKIVCYYYSLNDISQDILNDYDNLLKYVGWSYYGESFDFDGNDEYTYVKDNNTVTICIDDFNNELYIYGNVH